METVGTNESASSHKSFISSLNLGREGLENIYKQIQNRFNLILCVVVIVLILCLVSYIVITTFFDGVDEYMFIFQYCTIFTASCLFAFALYITCRKDVEKK